MTGLRGLPGLRKLRGLPGLRGVTGLRVMTALALASVAALLMIVIWAADDETVEADTGDVVRVGVLQGQSVRGYLDASRDELAALPAAGAETWALVSLTGYLPPDRLAAVLAGAAVAEVYARVPLLGAHTQVVRMPVARVPDDVVAGMLAAAAGRDREQADYHQLSSELIGGSETQFRLRRAYETAASTARAEAAAFRAGCACVFAAVVRAAPAVLTGLAARDGVRAVDPAPEVGTPRRAEFRPPLPEQDGDVPQESVPSATLSATMPAPSGTSALAPGSAPPLTSSAGGSVTSASPDNPAAGPVPFPAAP